jgi:uncharacterized protein YukJ
MKPHQSGPSSDRVHGLLVGKIKDGFVDPGRRSSHYEIWVVADTNYRVAVNVLSTDNSEVLAYFDPNFTAKTSLDLPSRASGAPGFTPLQTGPGGVGLDYLRDNLFPLEQMAPIPPEGAGVSLANLLDAQIERAKADDQAVILVCGQAFQDQTQDTVFGFSPANGVHDVHMMQGNSGHFVRDNRVHGDGALFIRFTGGETVALFIRFATQATETDNETGD